MTKLVFALIVSMGGQTISIEHWSSIQTCLWYSKQINSQHHGGYHRHSITQREHIHAKCIPVRVDPRKVEVFDH